VRRLLAFALAASLLPACGSGGGGGGGGGSSLPGIGGRRPNIVLIVADDLGYADLGVQGATDVRTPHIDSIAARGVRFTSGYASGAVCSPTRAGLLTGRYQQRFGHEMNLRYPFPPGGGLPVGEKTLADCLRPLGYATGLVGKWHLGVEPQFFPLSRGFDEFFGFLYGDHSYTVWDAEPANPVYRGTQPVVESTYLTDAFTREAVSFVDRHRDEPFFLYLAFSAPHDPLEAPAVYQNRFPGISDPRRRTFAAMMSAMDDGVGAVLSKLRALGIEDDTIVVFLSDNGGIPAENTSRNDPLRGEKGQLYEGGIRVPFMVQWTGRLAGGRVSDVPVSSLDLFATALAAAGGSPPTDRVIDSVDLMPYLDGRASGSPHPILFWRYGSPAAVRKGDWKLVKVGTNPSQLFDLAVDVREQTNLAASRPAVVAELEADLTAWKAQLVPPLW
jgi:arylsulfatase A-like enzyme